jgi:hypothetical protein
VTPDAAAIVAPLTGCRGLQMMELLLLLLLLHNFALAALVLKPQPTEIIITRQR